MSPARALTALLTLAVVALSGGTAAAKGSDHGAQHSLRAPLTGENFYFVMADRFENGRPGNDLGGLADDRMISGFDPTDKAFYHGGDLAGLIDQIDYIKGLGTTAIWLTPSFKNKAVQDNAGFPSAGYHGYWITDFTQIDPHLGTNDELSELVDEAHKRGMKVFFDIITNHTADVIQYEEGAAPPYVSKDREPYRTASGQPFDDLDYAGTNRFPPLSASTSFPYVPAAEQAVKFPAWLNSVERYHNRGNTTFTGEDSLYGDFFGLDDLFTEQPQVVTGMTEIYEKWIKDFSIDGFRIDTMKHVNDEFWQRFLPDVLNYAHRQGKREFFMFGEVFDTSRPFTSHFTTTDRSQAVLDFPFQAAAQRFAANSGSTDALRDFFADDDWYTDADSNAYQLPTFLGNHDMGRIGYFVQQANGGAGDAELLSRDRLAHQLMYLSRGNPVIYYGDEQGFTGGGDGRDQNARQDMFPSQVGSYNENDLIGTDATTAQSNFVPTHPLYTSVAALAKLAKENPALRDGAQQHRLSNGGAGAGLYAFSRMDRSEQREYVVALNNSESPQSASIPTYSAGMRFTRVYGGSDGDAASAVTSSTKTLAVTVPELSAVVYRADGRLARSRSAPAISLAQPAPAADRLEVGAGVAGDGFNEVTFLAKAGHGGFRPIGTDDNRPYRVFHDVSGYEPGTKVLYKAVVLDNAGNSRTTGARSARVAQPAIALEAPAEGDKVRDEAEVRAIASPDDADNVVTFQRRVGTGAWTAIGTDSSSPVYTAFDDVSDLEPGTAISYRAVLDYGAGTVTSAPRSVTVANPPLETAIVHYQRSGGDYAGWGLHLWGSAIGIPETPWGAPFQPTGEDAYGKVFAIPLKDDTKPVNFIVHQPGGDTVPTSRDPGGDRSFVPIDHPQIWLKGGDATVYFAPPG